MSPPKISPLKFGGFYLYTKLEFTKVLKKDIMESALGGEKMKELKTELAQRYNIKFKNEALLEEAFTHSSYVNEHRGEGLKDNERLEFLGDAVLEITVSDYLFHHYPDFPEGILTRLRAEIVREKSLHDFSKEANFDQHVQLGKGEEVGGGRQRPALLADVFEAFLGALYLDQGVKQVIAFLDQMVFPKISSGVFSHGMDYKTSLQEFLQRDGEISITYELIDESGPAHDRQFEAQVRVEEEVLGTGMGRTKKKAEQMAAKDALEKLEE